MRENHNIKIRDVQVGKDMAWHGLTRIESAITKDNCGIVYPMELQRLQLPNGDKTDHFVVVSTDDGLPIGNPVKKGYKLVSNERMIDVIESSLEGTKHEIVSVGSLGDREKVFASVRLEGDDFVAAGRETQSFLNILWGHGGVFSVTARSGFHVIVCQNTFNLALRNKKGEFHVNFKHTGEVDTKITNMAQAIESHYGVVAEFKAAMAEFEGTSIAKPTARALFAGFLVRKDISEIEDVAVRTENTIANLFTLFNTGKGNRGENRADAFNAFTDYYTHSSSGGENRWKQFESSEFGAGSRRKSEAYSLLRGDNVPGLGTFDQVVSRGEKILELI